MEDHVTYPCDQNHHNSETLACCRICLDPITKENVKNLQAFLLECRCTGAAMCTDCASKWFSVRRSLVCEVCNATVAGAPPALSLHVALRQASALSGRVVLRRPSGNDDGDALEAVGSIHRLPAFLAAYTTFCLLPGMLLSLATLSFCHWVLAASLPCTLCTAVLLSTVTIVRWVRQPNRPWGHLLYTMSLFGWMACLTVSFCEALPGTSMDVLILLGALTSMAASTVLTLWIGPLLKVLATSSHATVLWSTLSSWLYYDNMTLQEARLFDPGSIV